MFGFGVVELRVTWIRMYVPTYIHTNQKRSRDGREFRSTERGPPATRDSFGDKSLFFSRLAKTTRSEYHYYMPTRIRGLSSTFWPLV